MRPLVDAELRKHDCLNETAYIWEASSTSARYHIGKHSGIEITSSHRYGDEGFGVMRVSPNHARERPRLFACSGARRWWRRAHGLLSSVCTAVCTGPQSGGAVSWADAC